METFHIFIQFLECYYHLCFIVWTTAMYNLFSKKKIHFACSYLILWIWTKFELIFIFICNRPVPEREYVENYIKAFYLSEALLEQWLKDHQVQWQRQTFFFLSKCKQWDLKEISDYLQLFIIYSNAERKNISLNVSI